LHYRFEFSCAPAGITGADANTRLKAEVEIRDAGYE
jgi:hypothetical protein